MAQHSLEATLARSWPPSAWQDVSVLLAVSGGADSVAMLRAMHHLHRGEAMQLLAAHFNHELRGPQSAEDETFVVELCHQLGVQCLVGRPSVNLSQRRAGVGLEAAARRARYAFLRQTAARLGARYVVTAHTADDQVETILHRIVRGTGIAGLSGMARSRPLGEAATLIRPLLNVHRAEVLAYLADLGQPYRTDSTNEDTRLTRNWIRHELLPMLADRFNPRVAEALLRLGSLADEASTLVEALVDTLTPRCVHANDPNTVRIDLAPLASQPRYVVRELLIATWRAQSWPMRSMGYAEWDALAAMALGSGPKKRTYPGNVSATVDPESLTLTCERNRRP